MMACSRCGSGLQADWFACPRCGQPVRRQAPQRASLISTGPLLILAGIVLAVFAIWYGATPGRPRPAPSDPFAANKQPHTPLFDAPLYVPSPTPAAPARVGLRLVGKLDWKRESEFASYIRGKVLNDSGYLMEYVSIKINLYDQSGNLVDTTLANVMNLGSGETWSFECPVMGDRGRTCRVVELTGH